MIKWFLSLFKKKTVKSSICFKDFKKKFKGFSRNNLIRVIYKFKQENEILKKGIKK